MSYLSRNARIPSVRVSLVSFLVILSLFFVSACQPQILGTEATTSGTSAEETTSYSAGGTVIDVEAGAAHTLALFSDGHVEAIGSNDWEQCDTDDWANIKQIDARGYLSAGIHEDGTVVVAGEFLAATYAEDLPNLASFQDELATWTDIVAVRCDYDYLSGLKADGTVCMSSISRPPAVEIASWDSVVDIATSRLVQSGLKSDGSLLLTAMAPKEFEDPDIENWSDIVDLDAGVGWFVAGRKSDNTVVVSKKFKKGKGTDPTQWTDIVQISCGDGYLLGLQTDGSVVAAGWNQEAAWENVSMWQGIVDIAAGAFHSVGLTKEGVVLAEGNNRDGQCDVSVWNE